MTRRCMHVTLDISAASVRPLVLDPAAVKVTAMMQLLDGGGTSIGNLYVDVTASLTLAQRTALANFITNAVNALEAVNL